MGNKLSLIGIPSFAKGIKFIKLHFRRITVTLINLLFNHYCLFALIGLINKRIGLIESVFVAYPAIREYALTYAYNYHLKKHQWTPFLVGLCIQDGKIIVLFCISAGEDQVLDEANNENLILLESRTEKIKNLFVAKRKTFSGIIPGILCFRRIIKESQEADLTADVVKKAIGQIAKKEGLSEETPIIVLGGQGFIGRRVVRLLPKSITHSVDIKKGDWPQYLEGQRVIVVNITINDAITDYIDKMWPGMVVVNEVFPEPSKKTIEMIKSKKCSLHHVVGIKASRLSDFKNEPVDIFAI